MVLLLRS